MTEFSGIVHERRMKLAAEEWGKGIKDIHCFNSDCTSVWYDKEPDENGKRDGRVIDTRYNNGKIVRRISSTGKEIILDYGSEGKTIIDMFTQSRAYRKFIGWE